MKTDYCFQISVSKEDKEQIETFIAGFSAFAEKDFYTSLPIIGPFLHFSCCWFSTDPKFPYWECSKILSSIQWVKPQDVLILLDYLKDGLIQSFGGGLDDLEKLLLRNPELSLESEDEA